MESPIKILHIDPNYKIIYFIIRTGSLMKSTVPMEQAVDLLKNEKFDLILAEPQNRAILNRPFDQAVQGVKVP